MPQQNLQTYIPELMTREEAEQKHATLKNLQAVARSLLLEMRDRKGWLVLGYSSFEEYGEKEWGYSQSYIYRLAKAEEIQQSLNSPIGEIPETHLRPLGKIPAEHRQEIYDQVTEEAAQQGKEVTAKAIQEAVDAYKLRLEDEFNDLLNQKVEEVSQEYQAKIDHQKDVISRIKNQLALAKEENANAAQQQSISDLQYQIDQKQQELDQLTAQQEKALNDKNHELALSLREVDKGYQKIAANLIEAVQKTMIECFELNPENKMPTLSKKTHNKMLYAVQTLDDAKNSLIFLINGQVT